MLHCSENPEREQAFWWHVLSLALVLIGAGCTPTDTPNAVYAPDNSSKYEMTPVMPGQKFELDGLVVHAPRGSAWNRLRSPNISDEELCFIKRVEQHHTLLSCAGRHPLPDSVSDPMKLALEYVYSQIAFYSSGRYRSISYNFPKICRSNKPCAGFTIVSEDLEAIPTPPPGTKSVVDIEGCACPSEPDHMVITEISERKLESQSSYDWSEMRSFLSDLSFIMAE